MLQSNYFNKFIKLIGNILAIISIAILVKIFLDNIENIKHIEFNFYNLVIFTSLILLGILNYYIFSATWSLQLSEKYPSINILESFRVVSLTQIAKYLPGNIGHIFGRFYLVKNTVTKSDFTYSIIIESIIFVGTSCLVGSFFLIYINLFDIIDKSIFFLACILIISSLFVFSKYKKKIISKYNLLNTNKETLLKIFVLFLVSNLIGGLTIYILINIVDKNLDVSYLLCATGYSISFMLGFITPGAPGGMGVREYTFTLIFTPFITEIYALEVILIFRLLSMITDMLIFFIGKFITINKSPISLQNSSDVK